MQNLFLITQNWLLCVWTIFTVAKERLNLFARQFSRGKKKSPKAILAKATPSSYDHLIEDSNSLVSDDDDHEAGSSGHVRLDKKGAGLWTEDSSHRLIDWLVDCLLDWLIDCSIDWLIDWLTMAESYGTDLHPARFPSQFVPYGHWQRVYSSWKTFDIMYWSTGRILIICTAAFCCVMTHANCLRSRESLFFIFLFNFSVFFKHVSSFVFYLCVDWNFHYHRLILLFFSVTILFPVHWTFLMGMNSLAR